MRFHIQLEVKTLVYWRLLVDNPGRLQRLLPPSFRRLALFNCHIYCFHSSGRHLIFFINSKTHFLFFFNVTVRVLFLLLLNRWYRQWLAAERNPWWIELRPSFLGSWLNFPHAPSLRELVVVWRICLVITRVGMFNDLMIITFFLDPSALVIRAHQSLLHDIWHFRQWLFPQMLIAFGD